METAINRSKQDRKLHHSLSHFLYSKMLLSKTDPIDFDPFNWLTWVSVIALLLSVLLFVVIVRMHYRMQAIYLSMMSRIPSTSGQLFPTRYSYTNPISTTTTEFAWEFRDFKQWLLAIFPIEITLFCILILLIILITGYLI